MQNLQNLDETSEMKINTNYTIKVVSIESFFLLLGSFLGALSFLSRLFLFFGFLFR